MPHPRQPTRKGPTPAATPVADTRAEKIAAATSVSTNVPITSLVKFAPTWRTAGIVQKVPSFRSLSSVNAQCGR